MRRIMIIGTALAVLGGGAAFAASFQNTYAGSSLAFSKGAGSKAHPIALSEKVTLKAANTTHGNRAAPLTNLKFTIYGVKLDQGKLPVCTDALILKNKTSPTGGCPKGSLIGTGTTTALLGSGTDPTAAGTPCSPGIDVFNGGPKTQVFYFNASSASQCGGLTTGQTAPYDGHISYSGGNAIINVPLPPDISTKVAGQSNLYGSLISQVVNYPKLAQGRVYLAGVGCKSGKRPWSITFTATKYGGGSETQTVKGSSKC